MISEGVTGAGSDCQIIWTPAGWNQIAVAAGDFSDSTYDITGMMRFLGYTYFPIPQGAVIHSAILHLTASNLWGTIPAMVISGEDEDDPAAPTDRADFVSRVHTTATVGWTPGAWLDDVVYDSPDIKSIIQELVDRPGWNPDDNFIIFLTPVGVGWGGSNARISAKATHPNRPEITITHDSIPVAASNAATNVLATTATLNGTVTDDGGGNCEYRFRYKKGVGGGYSYTAWAGAKTTGQTFFEDLDPLDPNVTYYFNSQVKNYLGESEWSAELEFKTDVDAPTVTTQAVSNKTAVQAIGHGNITYVGGENCTKRGVCWKTSSGPTVADSKSEDVGSFDTGAFIRLMEDLESETHYYVKAYTYNSAGYAYGGEVEFDTEAEPPLVINLPVGITRIDALDYLAQLAEENVVDYSVDKSASDIITDLVALQVKTDPVTKGTIDFTASVDIAIPQDSILGALMRLREILGGYIYVDTDRALQWRASIGEDKGQQIRYRKNLKGITRTVDYADFANRLYVYGGGTPRTTLTDNLMEIQTVADSDIGRIWYDSGTPDFGLGGWGYAWRAGDASAITKRTGGGGRFLALPIPNGATIVSAHLKFRAAITASGTVVNTKIHGELDAAPATFSTLVDYTGRVRTVASVDWNAIAAWASKVWYESPDIKTVIQEIVDLVGWGTGDNMVLFWDDDDDLSDVGAIRSAWTALSDARSPLLSVRYTPAAADEYLEDLPSQIEHGGIYTRTLINKAILDSGTLYEWGVLELAKRKDPYINYTIDMVNLEAAGLDFEALQLGSTVTVIDEDLGIDVAVKAVRIVRDLVNPLNINVELANKSRDVLEALGRDFRWRQEFY